MTIAMKFPSEGDVATATRGGGVRRPQAPVGQAPRSAGGWDLLADARRCLAVAMAATEPPERYSAAHLGALRGAAAILICYPRPVARAVRNASAWLQLERIAPEFAEWAAFFAAGSAKRKAAEAGITRLISAGEADDLILQTGRFLDLIDRSLSAAA